MTFCKEVFLRIHRGLVSLNDQERIAPWAYRIARNAIIDHMRRGGDPVAALETMDIAEDVSWEGIDRDVQIGVAALARALPEKYRDAVVLAELEGFTQKEVASRLGLSLSGAKSRVQRGRELLRQEHRGVLPTNF